MHANTKDSRPMSFTGEVAKDDHGRPLYVSIEMVANLVYLASQSEKSPDQLQQYLQRASDILFDMRHHPDLSR
jgi:hypothetical protein